MPKNQVVPSDSPPQSETKEIQLKDYIKSQIEQLESNELYMIYKRSETDEQQAKMKLKQEKCFREKFDLTFPQTKESIPSSQTKSPKHYSANNRKVAVTGDQITATLANAKKQTGEEISCLIYDISTKKAAMTTAIIMANVYAESFIFSGIGYLVVALVSHSLMAKGGGEHLPFNPSHQSIEGYDLCLSHLTGECFDECVGEDFNVTGCFNECYYESLNMTATMGGNATTIVNSLVSRSKITILRYKSFLYPY